jgi:hypothetical protein
MKAFWLRTTASWLKWNAYYISISSGPAVYGVNQTMIESTMVHVTKVIRHTPLFKWNAFQIRVGSCKNLILENYEARKAEFYMKAFWHRTKASWLKSWAPEGRMGKMKCILYFYFFRPCFILSEPNNDWILLKWLDTHNPFQVKCISDQGGVM